MRLSSSTISTVQAAWGRILGVTQDSLALTRNRICHEKDDSSLLMFVSLFGTGVLVGPGWAIEAARELTDKELASHSNLLEMSAPHGGQALGEAALYFCDASPSVPRLHSTVSRQQEHAVALERACLPSDFAEVGLSKMENTFVLLADEDPASYPLAGSGYDTWEASLAHMGVLTASDERRRGFGVDAVRIAMAQAMASGLIPQWRARTDNTASIRTALRAGFEYAGTQTSVILRTEALS